MTKRPMLAKWICQYCVERRWACDGLGWLNCDEEDWCNGFVDCYGIGEFWPLKEGIPPSCEYAVEHVVEWAAVKDACKE